ncbi:MAG: aminotransferase class I/II-fold pyridoxal phosphate-dependent enzyme [Treponema sp.]|jgi:aspartate/methionine/tyrosine aminotransferase|nr:aminotransferase class I/II-fold pyridoxal phosphate-dependent enzyme [Treponema sp.]
MTDPSKELNRALEGTVVYRLLSALGRRFYFPRGIIAQSAEAKKSAYFANGTIGMAYKNGRPLILSAIADCMPTLSPEESVVYAPTAGVESARSVWKDMILQKNPSIKAEQISLPAVVPGLTAGLSYTADMFFNEGDRLLVSDPCWDNYGLIFHTRRGADVREVPFFGAGPGLNLDSIRQAVREEAKTGVVRILLNFPNNPSGYSPTLGEEETLVEILLEAAEGGADVLVICDDAYFGLFYENDVSKESPFVRFSSLHDRILAIKVDGPIKEDYIWGFRMGFVTYACRSLGAAHYDALIRKLMGAIRSSVSCANTPAQYIMLRAMEDKRTPPEKEGFLNTMKGRYRKVKNFIGANPPHPVLKPLPFNSGYFMCFRCEGLSAEKLRQELLISQGIGAISLEDRYLRIAFAGIDEDKIEVVYRTIYDTASRLLSPERA